MKPIIGQTIIPYCLGGGPLRFPKKMGDDFFRPGSFCDLQKKADLFKAYLEDHDYLRDVFFFNLERTPSWSPKIRERKTFCVHEFHAAMDVFFSCKGCISEKAQMLHVWNSFVGMTFSVFEVYGARTLWLQDQDHWEDWRRGATSRYLGEKTPQA